MEKQYKPSPLQWMISILVLVVMIGLAAVNGKLWYVTVSNGGGILGNLYGHYGLSKDQFSIMRMTFFIAFLAATLTLLGCMIQMKAQRMNSVVWFSAFLIFVVIVLEIYLQTRFIEKG